MRRPRPPVTSLGTPSLSLSVLLAESPVPRTEWAQSCICASCLPAWKALSPNTDSADFFSLASLCGLWNLQFPDQGLNPGPRRWDCGILTTRPPGNSQLILSCHLSVCSDYIPLEETCFTFPSKVMLSPPLLLFFPLSEFIIICHILSIFCLVF